MEKVGIAIVGVGKWGTNLLREFSKVADVRATVTRSSEITLEEVLNDSTVEAVVIATPIATHYDISKAALNAGKHVFLEKPGTDSKEKLAELYTLAEEKNLVLTIGYVFLHHPAFATLERIHKEDPILTLEMLWEKNGSFGEPLSLNLLSHDLATAIRLFGLPDRTNVTVRTAVVSECDVLGVHAEWNDGQTADILINRASSKKKKSVEAVTRSGRRLIWEGDTLSESGLLALEPGTALERECAAFVARVSSGTPDPDRTALAVHEALGRLT